ncbi:unnamed protein product [Schistosoma curassoni]|uniref:Secreted protein n=1 Tax=Schistosoma curassoni TaxID=6186 RepID=A0A183KRK5_9TREM|nr:unnamed protein product [Schistosoma curassoni]
MIHTSLIGLSSSVFLIICGLEANVSDHEIVVGGSQQETLDLGFMLLGTHQQGVPVILRELMLPEVFDPMSPTVSC